MSPETLYDEVPYPGCARAQTHPDRLATLATLFGMNPAPIEQCRVLELGCGDGANLIPVAFGLPRSHCVGIDLAPSAIAMAQSSVQALDLQNIEFRCLNLLETSAALGSFDYIIAHGLYSWVGAAVRDKIMEICQACLTPQGVAFISYNAYPGGHLRNMVREMMRFHVRDFGDPQERTGQSRALLKFVAESQCGPDVYQALMKRQFSYLSERSDATLYHDDLAETNFSVYFWQFVDHAARYDLQFLAEADIADMQDDNYPAQAAETLRSLGSYTIAREQYRDFLACRMFRQTLLCHKDVSLDRSIKSECVRRFYAASEARPASDGLDLRSRSREQFRTPKGATMETDHPLAKAAISELGDIWPQALCFEDLLARARARLGTNFNATGSGCEEDAALLEDVLLRTYEGGLIELYSGPPQFVAAASERPVASALARLQIARAAVVTNLRHSNVYIEDSLGRHLLSLLDGSRNRAALLEELVRFAESGGGSPPQNGAPAVQQTVDRMVLARALDENLAKTARLALLVA